MLKFGNFSKKVVFWGSRGVLFGFEPSKKSLYMIIHFFWRVGGQKNATFQNFLQLEKVITKLFGGPGGWGGREGGLNKYKGSNEYLGGKVARFIF